MKLDVFNWNPLVGTEKVFGKVWVKATADVSVFLKVEGYEVLVGTGTEIKATFDGCGVVRWKGAKDTDVFIYAPPSTKVENSEEIFSNFDRKPHDHGSVAAVTQSLRLMQIQHKHNMKEIREAVQAARPAKTDEVIDEKKEEQQKVDEKNKSDDQSKDDEGVKKDEEPKKDEEKVDEKS